MRKTTTTAILVGLFFAIIILYSPYKMERPLVIKVATEYGELTVRAKLLSIYELPDGRVFSHQHFSWVVLPEKQPTTDEVKFRIIVSKVGELELISYTVTLEALANNKTITLLYKTLGSTEREVETNWLNMTDIIMQLYGGLNYGVEYKPTLKLTLEVEYDRGDGWIEKRIAYKTASDFSWKWEKSHFEVKLASIFGW